ncbi:MAG TPA: hypothetical protein VHG71_09450 [Verrucomicrobiae bacterium]|nr:hypothetical protein [Verrucomicrobiae bacterium]
MNKKKSDWHIPSDWAFLFGIFVIMPTIAILAGMLLPVLSELKTASLESLFWSGLGLGGLGIMILFFARLPLYRQRKFLTFGPKPLRSFHRKLYWLAYALVIAAMFLLGTVWL